MALTPTLAANTASAACPCLTSLVPYNVSHIVPQIDGVVYDYGYGYGLGTCDAHDMRRLPGCMPAALDSPHFCSTHSGSPLATTVPNWCFMEWCYVNRSACLGSIDSSPSSYALRGLHDPGSELHYSYQTCGQCDGFSAADDPFRIRDEQQQRHEQRMLLASLFGSLGLLVLLAICLFRRWQMQATRKLRTLRRERLRYCSNDAEAIPVEITEPEVFHLFLSHAWKTGAHQMRIIKDRLSTEVLPGLRVFLDVDDLVGGHGVWDVDRSAHLLCFMSDGYAESKNCIRELCRAVLTDTPVSLMLEQDSVKGGFNVTVALEKLKESIDNIYREDLNQRDKFWGLKDEIAGWHTRLCNGRKTLKGSITFEDIKNALLSHHGWPPLQWSRQRALQTVSLRLLAARFVRPASCDSNGGGERATIQEHHDVLEELSKQPHASLVQASSSGMEAGNVEKCYMESELVRRRIALPRPRHGKSYHVYCSDNNAGAAEMLNELRKAHGIHVMVTRKLSDVRQLKVERFLVYLTAETWKGSGTTKFVEEVAEAVAARIPLLLVHEEPYVAVVDQEEDIVEEARHAQHFEEIEEQSRDVERLRELNLYETLYDTIAIALSGGVLRSTSRLIVAEAIAKAPATHQHLHVAILRSYSRSKPNTRWRWDELLHFKRATPKAKDVAPGSLTPVRSAWQSEHKVSV